uniref:Uncharacterized protein n=1 Tax=Arundo donax TaxID=35708 RepID=A0A0A8Z663_ARUDO
MHYLVECYVSAAAVSIVSSCLLACLSRMLAYLLDG